jgi:NADPH:quinone reductase-like Zn-dependent oxidoreductase
VIATTLRGRPAEEKAAICAAVVEHVWPLIGEGRVKTFVHEQIPFEEAPRAHALMESGSHSGKILLSVDAG